MCNEIRTPDQKLLVGTIGQINDTPVLFVKSRGKQDTIKIFDIIDAIENYLSDLNMQQN